MLFWGYIYWTFLVTDNKYDIKTKLESNKYAFNIDFK